MNHTQLEKYQCHIKAYKQVIEHYKNFKFKNDPFFIAKIEEHTQAIFKIQGLIRGLTC